MAAELGLRQCIRRHRRDSWVDLPQSDARFCEQIGACRGSRLPGVPEWGSDVQQDARTPHTHPTVIRFDFKPSSWERGPVSA